MTRDAKLFQLYNKDYKLLADNLSDPRKPVLQMVTAIYQMHHEDAKDTWYLILSVTKETDKIILDCGAEEISANDDIADGIKKGNKKLLFGNPSVKGHLPKNQSKDEETKQ